ncbi:MAG: chemotaxis protein CheX [Pseudobutyrivibrio sp.]|nr:chemotaxis protein CheX [Pseudobutyrivibrio sp.]
MYTQFLGNYLLQRGIINQQQLFDALGRISQSKLKLGTLAINEGLMTAREVDECLFVQTREDRRFGEIAIERGYLTKEQVEDMMHTQTPDFVLLCQIFVEDGVFSYEDFERIIFDYKNEAELSDFSLDTENQAVIKKLIEKFFWVSETQKDDRNSMYIELLFNSLIRFVDENFTPLTPMVIDEFPVTFGVTQRLISKGTYDTHIECDRETAMAFASKYAKEEFSEFNEYVVAAMEDFLNLLNGLYVVNVSNQFSVDIELEPPAVITDVTLKPQNKLIDLPIVYSFGTIHIIISY